jgi:hypothetical protein
MKSKLACTLFAGILLTIAAPGMKAALIIDAGPASSFQNLSSGNYGAGTEFTTVNPLTILSLGWLDAEGDGLGASHNVGLWDSGQNLLASALVTPSSATVLSAQGTGVWYMENITPLLLAPGTYRIAGDAAEPDSNALSGDKIGNGVTFSDGYVRTSFPDGGFAFPNETYGSNAIRATLSTTADGFGSISQVPEPATFALGGLGLLGLALTARRRK